MSDRDEVWHDGSDGRALVAPERIERLRPGAAAALPGDTVSLCVVDGDRMAVSILQSNFASWGSKLFVPGFGIALHNRGSSFSLTSGHPAEYGSGRRPPHTLSPALITDGGGLRAALATRGGHLQPQVLLQLTARMLAGGPVTGAVHGRATVGGGRGGAGRGRPRSGRVAALAPRSHGGAAVRGGVWGGPADRPPR